jgi:RHS repeat-associated protein
MNRALSLFRMYVAVVCLSPLVSLMAADLYRVTLVLYPGNDSAAVAKRLAAAYQGQLETAVDEHGTFEITLSSATADLLARDPQVGQVQRPEATAAAGIALNAATSWTIGNFDYDDAGNIKKIGTTVYMYDSESRLKSENVGTQTQQALTYDGFGNILSITEGSTSFTVGSDGASNRADVQSTAPNYLYGTYDGAGNMTSLAARTYTYDALNVMTKSTTDASRAYVYNANDERIGTINLTAPNGTEVSSQWTIRDPGGQVLRRFWKLGSEWRWMQDYIYRDGKMLASEANDQFKTLHYHLDHLGTPRLITGNGGVEVARHTYYPFGEEAPGTTPHVAEPKKFTGHERDSGGLDYMHARFYDYSMGRFLSVDPIPNSVGLDAPQSWNRYSYALNNPVGNIDPDGRCTVTQIDGSTHRDDSIFCLEVTASSPPPHWSSSELRSRAEAANQAALQDFLRNVGEIQNSVGQVLHFGQYPSVVSARSIMDDRAMQFVDISDEAADAMEPGLAFYAAAAAPTGKLPGPLDDIVTVSRWGRPGLEGGDWVMKGRESAWNYFWSGKWQPGLGNRFAPFSSGQSHRVLNSSLRWPRGWGVDGWIKGLLGQRRYVSPGM